MNTCTMNTVNIHILNSAFITVLFYYHHRWGIVVIWGLQARKYIKCFWPGNYQILRKVQIEKGMQESANETIKHIYPSWSWNYLFIVKNTLPKLNLFNLSFCHQWVFVGLLTFWRKKNTGATTKQFFLAPRCRLDVMNTINNQNNCTFC